MIAGYSFSIDHWEQKKINSMMLGRSSSPRESEIFHAIAPLCLTPVHDVFNILMNEKKINFPTVVADGASLLMHSRELPYNLAKIVV